MFLRPWTPNPAWRDVDIAVRRPVIKAIEMNLTPPSEARINNGRNKDVIPGFVKAYATRARSIRGICGVTTRLSTRLTGRMWTTTSGVSITRKLSA